MGPCFELETSGLFVRSRCRLLAALFFGQPGQRVPGAVGVRYCMYLAFIGVYVVYTATGTSPNVFVVFNYLLIS
jgi:hypothetical protein